MKILKRVRSWFKPVLYSCLVTLAAFHGLMTVLYNMPANPIKTLTNLQNAYIGQYFYQDWGMFAPNPIDMDIDLLLECLAQNGVSSGVLEVTSELVRRHQQNRFTSNERLVRIPDSYAHMFVSRDRAEEIYQKECKNDPSGNGCKQEREAVKTRQKDAKRGLTRVANAFCADMNANKSQTNFVRAHAWLALSSVPRWSKRNTEKKERKLVDVGMLSLAYSPAYGIWR